MRANFILGCLSILALESEAADSKCRALALSGGANYGSWEAGVMWGLTHYGNPEDFKWDVITGVSAGAINTCATVVFDVGDEVKMTEFLSDTWAGCATNEIWKYWPGGLAHAIFGEAGIIDDSPALGFINNVIKPFGKLSDRRFTMAAVNVDTGEYETFD